MIYVDSKHKQWQQKEEALLQSELQFKTDIFRKKLAPPKRGEKGWGDHRSESSNRSSQGALKRTHVMRKTDVVLVTSEHPKASA